MVDVGAKAETERMAVAEGFVAMSPVALDAIARGRLPKGDPLQVARLAGIQGAKRTPDLVPLCHPLPLDAVDVDAEAVAGGVRIEARVRTRWRTGVEMEAMTAVCVAALAVYDMVKAVDRGARIEHVRLLEKRGGKSGVWKAKG